MRVDGEINGVSVRGWIDVLDVDGRIFEIETAARKPTSVPPDYKFQVTNTLS
jgi:hypothetical protein